MNDSTQANHEDQDGGTALNGKMRFLIVGATGYTGRAVLKVLRARNIATIAHIRPDSPGRKEVEKELSEEGVELVSTPWEKEAFIEMLSQRRPTHVFSLLGTTKAKASVAAKSGQDASYERVDRDLSLLLLHALEQSVAEFADEAWPTRYLYLSAIGVREGSQNRYLAARAAVEQEIRRSKIPWIIAQPSFISGADRQESRPMERFGSRVSDTLLAGLARLGMKSPYQQYGSLNASQLALALVESAFDERAYGQTLDTEALRRRLSQG